MGVSELTAFCVHQVLCILGLLACGYAYYVEVSKAENEDFEAACDLSPKASCSVVLTSKYSRGAAIIGPVLGDNHPLNFSNAVYGALLYLVLIVLGFIPKLSGPLAVLHGIVVLHKVYLAYILLFILRDFCIVCTTMYMIDLLLLIVALYRWCQFKSRSKTKQE